MKPIPKLTELYVTISNDFKSKLGLSQDFLKKVLSAFTAVISAQVYLIYLHLSDIQDNVFPDNADVEANGGTLERQGRIWIGRNPLPATVGVFEISVIGVAGSVLRSGITFKSNEATLNPGQMFISDSEYTLTGSGDVIEIRSLGAGADFGLDVDDNLTITEPVIGVNQTVTITEIITAPRASEDIEVYRQIIIDSRQQEPQGGAKTDYRKWAADVQGVRKVYPYVKNDNAGVVQVFVEATVADSNDSHGTPPQSILDDVADVIEFDPDETEELNDRGRRPIQAIPEVLAISLIPVDVTITGLSDSAAGVRATIESNLVNYLEDVRPFIAGADLLRNKNDVLYSARLQSVATDVLESANFFTGFEMFVNGVSTLSYTFNLGNIPYLRDVTYS